jgi:signal transduction histidine kinase
LGWYTWIPSSVLVWLLVRRFPVDRIERLWGVAVHLIAAPVVSLFASVLYTGIRLADARLFGGPDLPVDTLVFAQETFSRSVALDSVLYFTILVAVHSVAYYRRAERREAQAARLEAELAEARLQALRLQLQPHFLFNTFHTIAMLVREGRDEAAVDTIAVLSDFLRYVLDHSGEQEMTLRQEVDVLQSYLAIERIRFDSALQVDLDVPAEAEAALVPTLILQPLVENAVRHGIEPSRRATGRLSIRARRRGDRLVLQVADDGVGLDVGAGVEAGIGLSNTRARLDRLYGDASHLVFDTRPGRGLTVTIEIPFHTANRPAPRFAPAPQPATAVQ